MARFPFYATTEEGLREEIKHWIKTNYGDVLGDKVRLLNHPEGLELLDKLVKERLWKLKNR